MPSLGASMEEGTLVQWMKKPGDALKRGDIIAVVDTEKGAIEIEVFEDGVLEQLRVQPGQKVPVGTVLAVVAESDLAGVTARVSTAASAPVTPTVPATPPPAPPRVSPAAAPSRAPRRATPAARSLASHLGVDLATVQGTGEGGAITRADVERARAPAAAAAAPVPPADASTRMRQAIAAAMSQSKRDIPHFYLATTIDVSRALDWLAAENAARPVPERLLPAALLVKSVALAMRDEPDVNGFWIDGGFRAGPGVHPGIAISLRGGGLVAPAIHDADRKDLTTLMERLRDVVLRARSGGLRSSELSDPTLTITNFGEQGVEAGFGIIYPPQVALVALGKIVERPVAVAGRVEVRPVITATLSADHRAIDGHRAGRFLAAIDRHLQAPEHL